MKQLLVASGRISTEDDVADAVLDLECILIEQHRTERTVFPVFVNEGDTYCELILGRGVVWGSLALPNTAGRRVAGSAEAVRSLRDRLHAVQEEWSEPFTDDWYRDIPPEVG